jgi:hypothetical protein
VAKWRYLFTSFVRFSLFTFSNVLTFANMSMESINATSM